MERLLTKNELWQLRQDITLNSLYFDDYENRFGFDTYTTLEFFNSYIDYLNELMEEDNDEYNDSQFFDMLDQYDNQENLYNYYNWGFSEHVLKILQ